MKIKVIKIGGEILSNEKTLNRTLKSISKINSPKLLVHGAENLLLHWQNALALRHNLKMDEE